MSYKVDDFKSVLIEHIFPVLASEFRKTLDNGGKWDGKKHLEYIAMNGMNYITINLEVGNISIMFWVNGNEVNRVEFMYECASVGYMPVMTQSYISRTLNLPDNHSKLQSVMVKHVLKFYQAVADKIRDRASEWNEGDRGAVESLKKLRVSLYMVKQYMDKHVHAVGSLPEAQELTDRLIEVLDTMRSEQRDLNGTDIFVTL